MIHARHASKSFGHTRAVDRVSFEIAPRGVTALLGPNGAGKTTTIRLIAGYLRPDHGSITLAGIDVAKDPVRARRHLGYLPEAAPLYPELNARQYLDYRARLFGLGRTERRNAAAAAIDRCRLADMAHKPIAALSKGYRQRVGLASAMLHDPAVLILDEPTNGLDPSQIRSARTLIRELAEHRAVLLCTHVIPEVERTCDRALVIAAGRLIADGTPDALAGGADHARMECRGPDDQAIRAALAARFPQMPAISTAGGGWLVVRAASTEPDATERLADAAHAAGRAIRSLGRPAPRLEDRVVDLIEHAHERVPEPEPEPENQTRTGPRTGARPVTAARAIAAIAGRELGSMCRTPVGWIVTALYVLLTASVFTLQTVEPGEPATLRYFFTPAVWLLLAVAPAVSMRLFSEEFRTGTIEPLLTAPVSALGVLLGKYAGALAFVALMLAPTLVFPATLALLADGPIDWGAIASGYLGLLLVASVYLALGTLVSTTTDSQVLAFLVTLIALLMLMILAGPASARLPIALGAVLNELSIQRRAAAFAGGVLETRHLAFFVLASAWLLALAWVSLLFREGR
jgi:ABC-2 type transport system ATP-binding protein